VSDSRAARDSRSLDTIGHYNPRTDPIEINVDAEKATKWLSQGAKPTETVERLFRRAGILPTRARSRAMAAQELIEFVAKSLVDNPDEVTVQLLDEPDGQVLELHVAEDDMGKVIGRNGSVAKALRTLLKVMAARDGESISLEIV
jgi:ribosomal protein S16